MAMVNTALPLAVNQQQEKAKLSHVQSATLRHTSLPKPSMVQKVESSFAVNLVKLSGGTRSFLKRNTTTGNQGNILTDSSCHDRIFQNFVACAKQMTNES